MVSLRKRKIFLFDLLFVFVCLFPSLFVCLPAQGGLIGLHPHQLLRLLHHEQEELENDATGDKMRWRVREAPQKNKRENVGIFPKWGTPPPCLGTPCL